MHANFRPRPSWSIAACLLLAASTGIAHTDDATATDAKDTSAAHANAERPVGIDRPGNAAARNAIRLFEQGDYAKAHALLESLTQADFDQPAYVDIRDVTEDMTVIGERIQPPPLALHKLLLAQTWYHVGEPGRAAGLAWQLIESDVVRPELFELLVTLHRDRPIEAALERLAQRQAAQPDLRAPQWAARYLTIAMALAQDDFDPAIDAIRSGSAKRNVGRGMNTAFREWVSRQLATTTDRSLDNLLASLREESSPTWIIYTLGISGDIDARDELEAAYERLTNSWIRVEILGAIARIDAAAYQAEHPDQTISPLIAALRLPGDRIDTDTIRAGEVTMQFVLVNDGEDDGHVRDVPAPGTPGTRDVRDSRLIINGEPLPPGEMIVSKELAASWYRTPAAGQSTSWGHRMGERFAAPGRYRVQWRGERFESQVVMFEVVE